MFLEVVGELLITLLLIPPIFCYKYLAAWITLPVVLLAETKIFPDSYILFTNRIWLSLFEFLEPKDAILNPYFH